MTLAAATPEAPGWSSQAWSLSLSDEHGAGMMRRVFGISDDGSELVGLVAVTLLGRTTELESLLVHPARRRQGMGLLLVRYWLDWARASGADEALLEVREGNAKAQALYCRLGFREGGRRLRYYTNPEEDAVLMAISLCEHADFGSVNDSRNSGEGAKV